jgi:putative transposase
MRGRYNGASMGVFGNVIPRAMSAARRAENDISREATQRLRVIDWHRGHGENVSLTARHFGLGRPTVYRWLGRFDPARLSTLENRSTTPQRRRRPSWSSALVQAVQQLREEMPRWGKDKLVVLLRRQGYTCSTSMVGRILADLRARRVLQEPRLVGVSARKRLTPRPYATRKPKEYLASQPGDIVQLDTLDIRTSFSHPFKQFTARDVVSRWDVLEVHSAASASLAAQALDAMLDRFPFTVRAIQVDGGSEFMAEFEQRCQARGLRLFVLPPRSPKLNGAVERANRTHTEEFYEVYGGSWTVADIRLALLDWERTYNTVRPHQALAYLTPQEWLARHPPPLSQGAEAAA